MGRNHFWWKNSFDFVERGVKINVEVYQNRILKEIVKPWTQNYFKESEWTFQQDWAPAHGSKSTLSFCQKNWGKDLWPSNSPDLNPMDFSVWSILESRACAKSHKSVEALKCLEKAWATITKKELSTIIENFRKRQKACVKAKGGNFEHLLK